MDYVLLIAVDPNAYAGLTPDEQQAIFAEYGAYTQKMIGAGKYVHGNALQGLDTATTVQLRNGARTTTDGPFAESKEVLVGYYVVTADSLDEALDWAAQIPDARYGSIEVRPIMDLTELM
jgi:hypothetical protein